mmetsp:Transcript_17426/g.16620  ORF Transcript_17426/g.16620 Transcript_17426/m.16620 type:complete len:245 (+) Transcript_17426:329-1063(+)
MEFIDSGVELIKELFLLPQEVLELLQSHFILPLDVFEDGIMLHDVFLTVFELLHNLIMDFLLVLQAVHIFIGLLERNHHLLVGFFLVPLGLLLGLIFPLGFIKFILELFDQIQVGVSDLLVIVFDVIVLLCMLACQVLDGCILLVFDLLNHLFSLPLHFFPQEEHLVLVLQLDLIGYPLILLPHLGGLLVLLPGESIQILRVSHLLLLLLNLQSPNVLLELPFVHSVFIFNVLQSDLRFLLQFS